IWGTVRDQQGAVVPGATVRAVNEETGMMRTAVADLAGRYAMPSLMDRRSIGDRPRGSGNYSGLVLLQPGVTSYAPAAGFSFEFSAGQRFSAAAGRGYTNSFLLDGTDINDHANGTPGNAGFRNPGIESVREFAVLTEGYKAEYGRASGGIVAAVTRSGTNQFHGSAYEFHSNSAINARNFFDLRTLPYRGNRFGASLGGPIRRDQTFF